MRTSRSYAALILVADGVAQDLADFLLGAAPVSPRALQPAESVWTTTVNVFEVVTGLHRLPDGRRRRHLEQAFNALLVEELDGRVQSFDTSAAVAAGEIAAHRQTAGRIAEIRDVQIAGIATARRAQLATRNTRHFTDLGITLIDPWTG